MTSPAFRLTRRAAMDLRAIHAWSQEQWGATTAQRYLDDLYRVMRRIAERPEDGELRRHRSAPFLMVPARRHIIVFDRVPTGVIVLTVLHQRRDIEAIIARQEGAFLQQVDDLRRRYDESSRSDPQDTQES